ncbi:MAG TPA: nucleoside hydrolase [Phycisphaerae bacterium]|nr:nucleoside hydrolase [Phycisphaerae bacterium]
MEPVDLWLDTDIGNDIDDAVALAYLLRQPRANLVGVSTVTGPVADRARIASAVAMAAGRDDVPIYAGCADAMSGPGQPTCPQAERLDAVPHRKDFAADPAAALAALGAAARRTPGRLTLLAVGPLTNLARFFQDDPDLPRLLGRVVLMGGHFYPDKPGAEWNILCDPVAAARVAEAPVARTWYGLDVTLQCRLHRDEVRQRFRGPLLEAVYRFAEVWFRRREHIVFHDPLAAAAIFEPSLCTLRPARVEVQTAGEFPGRTVPHEAARPEADRIATTVDAKAFFDHYFAVTA